MNQLLKKKQNQLKAKKGFTLVELIIVIAIIAILAAVAIPKFGAIKKDANLAADQANAKIIATAVATAVSNGDITGTDSDVTLTDSQFIKYIDGNAVPISKTDKAAFVVKYSNVNGVTITLGGSDKKQVYPVPAETPAS